MEFIQKHIPHIPNWETIGQNMTQNSGAIVSFIKDYWLGILLLLALIGFIGYHIFSKPKPDDQSLPKIIQMIE